MLEVKNIVKSFGRNKVLNKISFKVNKGDIVSVIGPSGSGKSTLAKIIGGIYFPTEGTITFGAEDYTKTTPKLQKKRGVIITSQELSLFPNLSVAENLNITDMPTKGCFSDYSEMGKRAREILHKIKFDNLIDEKVANLIAYLRKMNDDLNIPHCIKNYGADSYPTENGFVPEEVFLERLPEIAANAILDACTGSNPRQPSQEEMEKLLKCCYYDTEVDF
mgnify:CR=1 FL=1